MGGVSTFMQWKFSAEVVYVRGLTSSDRSCVEICIAVGLMSSSS